MRDKAKALAATQRWRNRNRDKLHAYDTAARAADPDKFRARERARYHANIDRRKAGQKTYRDKNRPARLQKLEKYRRLKASERAIRYNKTTHCEICGSPPGKRDLHWDHDHVSGKHRGWLCFTCNVGLGAFKDNPDILRAAAVYIETRKIGGLPYPVGSPDPPGRMRVDPPAVPPRGSSQVTVLLSIDNFGDDAGRFGEGRVRRAHPFFMASFFPFEHGPPGPYCSFNRAFTHGIGQLCHR